MPHIIIPDLDELKFAGVRILYESITVEGGIDDHVHKFPHAAGGAPEKLGRKLYEVTIVAKFLSGSENPELAYQWPRRLNELQKTFEAETTQDLQLPSIGTIKAYCFGWTRVLAAQLLNGEATTLRFREDLADQFSVAKILTGTVSGIVSLSNKLQLDALTVRPVPDILDQIVAAVGEVQALLDTADMYNLLFQAKVQTLLNILNDADRRVDAFNDPNNFGFLDALHALWASTLDLYQDIFQGGTPLESWTVPALMSAAEVSTAIYGSTTHAVDIMNLNPLPDPYAIAAGTVVRYYPD